MKRRILARATPMLLASLLAASPGSAQVQIGAEADFANDFDLGIGGRLIVALADLHPRLSAEGSVVYFFPSESVDEVPGVSADVDYWEFNANLRYSIAVDNPNFAPYVGAGLNIGRLTGSVQIDGVGNASESDTEVGLNALGGVQFGSGRIRPFAEARVQIGGGEQFVLAGGATIPVG